MMQSLRIKSEEVAAALRQALGISSPPSLFLQTGSGLALDDLLDTVLSTVEFGALPHLSATDSPAGHALRFHWGLCGGRHVLLCAGRRHFYEGLGVDACVLPVCAAAWLGTRHLALVCAAGGINCEYRPGTMMVMADFINTLGASPLAGPTPLGQSYFQSMNEAFSQNLISTFINAADEVDLASRLGVYQANPGPQYETPAEVRVARSNGADAVGMSVVLETIAGRALGCQVLGLAVITNLAASDGVRPPEHGEVLAVGQYAGPHLTRALRHWIATGDFVAR